MNLKILLCILYFFNYYSECFILNRENTKDNVKRSPTEMEYINYGSGQSNTATKALTLSDVDEDVAGKTPHFTIKEKRCPRHGEVVGAVYQPVASQQINRRDLQSTINKRLCETCKASNTCSKLGNCDYCSRWCDRIDEQSTATETVSVNDEQQNIVGQIHQIKPENIEHDPTKVSSRFGENAIGQANPSSSMPKYYVLGRLDAIMAIQIISKILGVQNPDDIKQLLILGSTKSDNPPVFGPSMHNISPEKANILTQALNNELEKLLREKPDGVLSNDDLNTAIENAVKNVESANPVVGSQQTGDDEKVGCLEDLKEKIKDKLDDLKGKKEEILPVYPIDPYQSNYRADDSEIKNPKVIQDAPDMSENVDLQSRLIEVSTTVSPMENEEKKEDIVAAPAQNQEPKVPDTKENDENIEETPERGRVRTFTRKFPSFQRKTEDTSEPTVGQSNDDNKNSILTSPTLQKLKKKFPHKYSGPYSRANKPILAEKDSKPSAANILGRTRQFTLVPVTTEKIVGATEEEPNTLNVAQNEKPQLESANHFGVPEQDKVVGDTNSAPDESVPSSSNILKPMEDKLMENAKLGSELGGDIMKVVEDNIGTNENDPIEGQSPDEENAMKQGTKLGKEIVDVVNNNFNKPQGKGIFNMLEDQMKQSQKNLKNIFDVARANQAETVGDSQDSNNNMTPEAEETIGAPEEPPQNVNVMSRVPEIQNPQTESMQPIIVEPENLRNADVEEVGAPQMPQIFEQPPPEVIDPSQMPSEGQIFEEQPTMEENVDNEPMDVQESNDVMPQQENPDMMEARTQPENGNNGENIVGNKMEDSVTNHFGKIIPVNGNSLQDNKSPNNVFFLGNGIKLPLQMHQNKDGSMDISVDMDRLCTCQNSTCPRNHNEIAETVGTILEKEAELKNQLESIDAGINHSLTNTNNKQIRRDLGAMNNNKFDHMEMLKRASNPFVPQSNALQMSQFLSNDVLSTTPKQYPTLNDIVQMRDMYKYKKLEQELANKLQTLNRNVEQYKDENAKLFNKGAKTIFKTNDENIGVQKQVDILNNVLGWMKTVALTNTK